MKYKKVTINNTEYFVKNIYFNGKWRYIYGKTEDELEQKGEFFIDKSIILTEDKINLLIRAIRKDIVEQTRQGSISKWTCDLGYLFIIMTGIRFSELIDLTYDDITEDKAFVGKRDIPRLFSYC